MTREEAETISQSVRGIQKKVHALSRSKGWYDNGERNIPEMLALIHSEVSEALEAYRTGEDLQRYTGGSKPEGFGVELADIVIRVMDLAEYLSIDLESMIHMKHAYNATRPYRHGGKKA